MKKCFCFLKEFFSQYEHPISTNKILKMKKILSEIWEIKNQWKKIFWFRMCIWKWKLSKYRKLVDFQYIPISVIKHRNQEFSRYVKIGKWTKIAEKYEGGGEIGALSFNLKSFNLRCAFESESSQSRENKGISNIYFYQSYSTGNKKSGVYK